MNKTKLSFGFMILFFIFLIIASSIFFQEISSFQKSLLLNSKVTSYASFGAISDFIVPGQELTTYSQNQTACAVAPFGEKLVILRVDDLGAWHYYGTVRDMANEILSRNMSVSFGVIPEGLEKDKPFIEWIKEIKDDSRVEIAQHGYKHEDNEFENLNSIEAFIAIEIGKQEIIEKLRVVPVTFIPPSNEYNADTVEALEEAGFRIISARDAEFNFSGEVLHIGGDSYTKDYYENRFVSVEEVLINCLAAWDAKSLCVIVMHPQDYISDEDSHKTDELKYAEFIKLLNTLEELGAEFRNFNDFVNCGHNQTFVIS